MDGKTSREYLDGFIIKAVRQWGNKEVERIKSSLEKTSAAMKKVEEFKLDPVEDSL